MARRRASYRSTGTHQSILLIEQEIQSPFFTSRSPGDPQKPYIILSRILNSTWRYHFKHPTPKDTFKPYVPQQYAHQEYNQRSSPDSKFILTKPSLWLSYPPPFLLFYVLRPRQACQPNIYIIGQTVPGCVVPVALNAKPSQQILACADRKSTTEPVASFSQPISKDLRASACTLTAWERQGCVRNKGPRTTYVEAESGVYVDLALVAAVGWIFNEISRKSWGGGHQASDGVWYKQIQ